MSHPGDTLCTLLTGSTSGTVNKSDLSAHGAWSTAWVVVAVIDVEGGGVTHGGHGRSAEVVPTPI